VVREDQGPHPRASYRRDVCLEDAADNFAIGKHAEIVVIPMAGKATKRRALQLSIGALFFAARNKLATTNANSEISNANCEFRDKASSNLQAKRSSFHMSSIAGFVWSRPWPRVHIGRAI
jgi:hypothetical protein